MELRTVIAATLSTVAGLTLGTSCFIPWSNCGVEGREFEGEYELLRADMDALMLYAYQDYETVEDVPCKTLCSIARGWSDPTPGNDTGGGEGGGYEVHGCNADLSNYTPPEYDGNAEVGAGEDDTGEGETAEPGDDIVGMVSCDGSSWWDTCESAGRRPLGHVEARIVGGDELGRAFARAAYLEAASVTAFLQLARQLEAWGAPSRLVGRCRSAAADEVRHARVMTRFARERGVEVPTPRQEPAPTDMLSAAMHNASEGCVNETWSALLAHWTAHHAHDAALRDAYAQIAEDETRHAQLAWDLHEWFMAQFDGRQRERVLTAQRRALHELERRAGRAVSGSPTQLAMPTPAQASDLARDFASRLAA